MNLCYSDYSDYIQKIIIGINNYMPYFNTTIK